MSTVRTLTLADAALPGVTVFRDAALVVGASVLTALAAQVAVPLPGSPVPLTGQTFAVLLTGAALGARRGFLAQALYLLEGASGLPVFAGGLGGAWLFAGPTGGFLAAFPLAAAVTGMLAGPGPGPALRVGTPRAGAPGWDRRFGTTLAAMLLGSAVILLMGTAWLARFLPVPQALAAGLWPFIPGDLLKAVAAALVLPAAWRVRQGRAGRVGRGGPGA
jgi:biotin transport system substrate-specific component